MAFTVQSLSKFVMAQPIVFSIAVCSLGVLIVVVLANSLYWPLVRMTADPKMPYEHRRRIVCPPPKPPGLPPRRTQCDLYGCDVYGWPSRGGVIIRPTADAVELDYLGLDRLNLEVELPGDQEIEDEFCKSLLRIGGVWWPSERRYRAVYFPDSGRPISPVEGEQRICRYMAWPKSGGVWVSTYEADEEGDIPLVPEDIGRLRLCFTMEERCELLRTRFGATFYPTPEEFHILHELEKFTTQRSPGSDSATTVRAAA